MKYFAALLLSATLTLLRAPVGDGRKSNPRLKCAYTFQQYCCPNSRRIYFYKNNVTPEVLKSSPRYIATVVYNSGKNYACVCLGNQLTSNITAHQPFVSWPSTSENKYYTLVIYGTLLKFNHLIVRNIPGNSVDAGEPVSTYVEPIPPPLTGPHRYIIAIFEQIEKIAFKESPMKQAFRPFFDLDAFVEEYNLKLYAANYFFCISNLTPDFKTTLLE